MPGEESEPPHWEFLLYQFLLSHAAEAVDPPADGHTDNADAIENLTNTTDFTLEGFDSVPHDSSITFTSNGVVESQVEPNHIAPPQDDRYYSSAPTTLTSTAPVHAVNPERNATESFVHSESRISAVPRGVDLDQVNVHNHRNGHGIVGQVGVHGRRYVLDSII